MQLFYAPEIEPPLHTLGEEESKHCIRVLRLGCGDSIHLTDGRGGLFRCEIVEPDPRRCTVRVVSVEREYGRLPYRLTMAVAPTKHIERFEWFLEKATEVGVDRIVPIESAHSERRTIKPERETKVIAAAVKQSLKAYCPVLEPMATFREFVARPFAGRKFIAHCAAPHSAAGRRYLPAALGGDREALVMIGPEGDFSAEEIALALANGFEEISLGDQRLRTETAAVAAVVMVSVAAHTTDHSQNA